MHDEIPTPIGLLRCLEALAEETASIGLTSTWLSLQQAMNVCRMEAGLPRRALHEPAMARLLH